MKAFNGTPHSNGGRISTSRAVKDTPNSKRKAPAATIGGGSKRGGRKGKYQRSIVRLAADQQFNPRKRRE